MANNKQTKNQTSAKMAYEYLMRGEQLLMLYDVARMNNFRGIPPEEVQKCEYQIRYYSCLAHFWHEVDHKLHGTDCGDDHA